MNLTRIEKSNTSKKKKNKKKSWVKKIAPINVNKASVEDWRGLPGIGTVFSERIVKFRNRLGGFYSIEQLKEVYGVSEDTYEMIRPHLLQAGSYKTIDLKEVTFKKLLAHPYFDYEDVKSIKNYLRKNNILTKPDLMKASKRDAGWVNKIWPYVKFASSAIDHEAIVQSK